VKPAPFEYHAPTTVEEAVGLLGERGDAAKPLAGGQSLVPLLALRLARFEHLVDLNRVAGLDGVERDGDHVRVGALVRQATAEHDPTIARDVPLLARALPHVGHFQIRNRGTVGGSTAHADPASELPAVARALDAELVAAGPGGERVIAAGEFFEGTWTTALRPDEVLVAIRYPVWDGRRGFAVRELARRPGDFALAGVVCGLGLAEDGRIDRAAIALFGMGPTPVRASRAEAAARAAGADGRPLAEVATRSAEVAAAVAAEAVAACDPVDDLHAPAWYRRRIAARLVAEAFTAALEEASRV
jgi:carbon-monoxide dehydrogenase medium subunit